MSDKDLGDMLNEIISKFTVISDVKYNVDESIAQSVSIYAEGKPFKSVYAKATTATDFTLSGSFDGVTWVVIDSVSAVTIYAPDGTVLAKLQAFPYVKLGSAAAGVSGTDTVSLIVSASR